MSSAQKLVHLQIIRAFAALVVVVDHSLHEIRTLSMGQDMVALYQFPWSFGVDIFFFLSGFLMWVTTRGKLDQPAAATRFMERRLARIVPAYWFYTLLLAVGLILVPSIADTAQFSVIGLIKSLFFVPFQDAKGDFRPILMQGWTINYEMYFYLIFAVMIKIFRGTMRNYLYVYFPLCVAINYILGVTGMASFWFSSITLEFLIGVAVADLHFRGVKINKYVGFALVMAGLALLHLLNTEVRFENSEWRIVYLGLPSLLIFLFFTLSDMEWRSTKLMRFFVSVGDASYSLYLCHPFVLAVLTIIIRKTGLDVIGFWPLVALYVASSMVAAHLSYIWMERPASAWCLEWLTSRGRKASAARAA